MRFPRCRHNSLLLLLLQCACAQGVFAQQVQVSVFALFHPGRVRLTPTRGQALIVTSSKNARIVLNGEAGRDHLLFENRNDTLQADEQTALSWSATARDGGPAEFQLEIPGKLTRIYRGQLSLRAEAGVILLQVGMERETAVASIVAAEMRTDAPLEALKAQAIVTRSFLATSGHHAGFDFCDTTHCQFLKSPPAADSPVWRAVEATRGLVLNYRGKTLAALYSSRCGGRTRTLRESGLAAANAPSDAYPYFAVDCLWCHKHPLLWRRTANTAPPDAGNERARIQWNRQKGWNALPGSNYTLAANGSGWQVEGHNTGHGLGLCQIGAIGMAESGAEFHQILAFYYPNTVVLPLEPRHNEG